VECVVLNALKLRVVGRGSIENRVSDPGYNADSPITILFTAESDVGAASDEVSVLL
jgi:hypothetical protein